MILKPLSACSSPVMNKYRLEVYEEIPPDRWFSNNDDFALTEHLAILRDFFLSQLEVVSTLGIYCIKSRDIGKYSTMRKTTPYTHTHTHTHNEELCALKCQ